MWEAIAIVATLAAVCMSGAFFWVLVMFWKHMPEDDGPGEKIGRHRA